MRERQKWCSKHLQTWNTQTVTEQQSVKPSWMRWNPSSLGKNGWNSLRRSTSRKSVAGSESRSKRCCACISCRTGSVSRTRESINNKDSKGNRSNDKQGEKTRGNSTETTGNPKDNSKKENTDPNRERRVELGKTIGIETFKFGGDLPVTLLNKQADSLAKEYRSLQKEIPAYVVKQGRLTKVGVLSPLGLIYDTYQDAQKYNGEKFVVATVINGASFAVTLGADNALVGTGVGAIAVSFANSGIAMFTNSIKEFLLGDTNKKQGRK